MFCSTENKGFWLQFENGLTISVQWGEGNYGARPVPNGVNPNSPRKGSGISSQLASVCIWNTKSDVNFTALIGKKVLKNTGDGNEIGWINSNEVAKLIAATSTWTV